ncbi:ester cyclase [Mesobaculum littorinae]|uniref:Ester cyclase n=1 Tax=Mesobaculum littorinae TaxID=2486419 RepID=A0A438AKZ2_9RHOB|nr:ester cyclase [Mesobaculum littorinae]RVV99339.1 ester cyclase [Mesobaculum littorinae]
MTDPELVRAYHGYIDCLNAQDWPGLDRFVHPDVAHDGKPLGLSGYRKMLQADYRAVPDLHFNIVQLVTKAPQIACRLRFDCTPSGTVFGLPVNGRRVRFEEHVFYTCDAGLIRDVRSIIDTEAIKAQITRT